MIVGTSKAYISPSTSPFSSSASTSLAVPAIMLSVVYPSNTMYVASPQQYYYVQPSPQPAAGQQWASVVPVSHNGAGYVLATAQRPQPSAPHTTLYQIVPQQQHIQPQATIAVPRPLTTSMSLVKASQPTTVPVAPVYQPAPNTAPAPTAIPRPIPVPSIQRKRSSVNLSNARVTFEDRGNPDEEIIPASPVLSDSTSSSSSSGSSHSSHLNISRSAMNHYTTPHRQRPRRESTVPLPSAGISPQALPPTAPFPQQPVRQLTYPPVSGTQLVPVAEPVIARNTGLSTRPVSFHENQAPVYSSYELYQPPHRAQAPARPALTRRASSRSFHEGMTEMDGSAYGTGLGMGAPGLGMGMGYDDYGSKKKWWKGGR